MAGAPGYARNLDHVAQSAQTVQEPDAFVNGTHSYSTGPTRACPRCEARTRKGTPCQGPAIIGKARCRTHGGAAGSGALGGIRNVLKHGRYTAEARAFEAHVGEVPRRGREGIEEG